VALAVDTADYFLFFFYPNLPRRRHDRSITRHGWHLVLIKSKDFVSIL
jgi:hypothetical protein